MHESVSGTKLHFAATQQFGRFRSEADIQRAAITEPDLGVRASVSAHAAPATGKILPIEPSCSGQAPCPFATASRVLLGIGVHQWAPLA